MVQGFKETSDSELNYAVKPDHSHHYKSKNDGWFYFFFAFARQSLLQSPNERLSFICSVLFVPYTSVSESSSVSQSEAESVTMHCGNYANW
jgi:hypothetical protein